MKKLSWLVPGFTQGENDVRSLDPPIVGTRHESEDTQRDKKRSHVDQAPRRMPQSSETTTAEATVTIRTQRGPCLRIRLR